jgi:hypothetical protein
MISPAVTKRRSGLATRAPSRARLTRIIVRASLRRPGLGSVSLSSVPQPDGLCNEEPNHAGQKDPDQDPQDDHNRRGHRKPLVDRPPRLGRRAWSQPAGGRRTECDLRAIATTVSGHAPTVARTLMRLPTRFEGSAVLLFSFFSNGFRNKGNLSTYPLDGCNRNGWEGSQTVTCS